MLLKLKESDLFLEEKDLKKSLLLKNLYEDEIKFIDLNLQKFSKEETNLNELKYLSLFLKEDKKIKLQNENILYNEKIFLLFFSLKKNEIKRLLDLSLYFQYKKFTIFLNEIYSFKDLLII